MDIKREGTTSLAKFGKYKSNNTNVTFQQKTLVFSNSAVRSLNITYSKLFTNIKSNI